MQRVLASACLAVIVASFATAQQANPPAPAVGAQPEHVKIYSVGPGVTAPELLPLNMPLPAASKCKKKADGIVMLSVIIDATGRPRNVMFFHPVGTDLDKFALQTAAADRFKPGTSEGAPVAVAQLLDVTLQGCVEQTKDDAGKKMYLLRLRSQPQQKLEPLPQPPQEAILTSGDRTRMDYKNNTAPNGRIGVSIKAPVPIISPEAVFTDAARKARYEGICVVSLIVDKYGMPQDIKIVKKLDYGLDQKAMDAVMGYRFKPAMKDGEPVAVMITVEVSFRLY